MSINCVEQPAPSHAQEPAATVTELRERLMSEFDQRLHRRVIDGVLRGYLERYGVDTDEPGATTLHAVERTTRLALAARLSSCPLITAGR